jgi:hypothetical protein
MRAARLIEPRLGPGSSRLLFSSALHQPGEGRENAKGGSLPFMAEGRCADNSSSNADRRRSPASKAILIAGGVGYGLGNIPNPAD